MGEKSAYGSEIFLPNLAQEETLKLIPDWTSL